MQIEERVVEGVTILDLKGKMTLGEGDELLKDKINSLIQQDRKKLLLNLEGVPYIDSAGPGRDCPHVHDGQPAGRQAEAAEPDQADPGSARHYQAADGVRDLRVRTRRGQELRRLATEHHPPRSGWRDIQFRTSSSGSILGRRPSGRWP